MGISNEVLHRVRAVAARQDWVVTAAQLRAAGAGPDSVRRMVRSGQWVPLARGRWWVGPDPRGPSLRSRLRAVLLGCGPRVVVAGPTAARLLGIQGLPRDDGALHFAVPPDSGTRSHQGRHVHHTSVPPEARMLLDGIPLTSPARTCADLLLALSREEAVSALDSALHQRLLAEADRRTVLAHLSGRRGAPQARARVPLADARAESPLETRIRLICLDGGLPPPVLQWRIRDPQQGWQFRIDLGWPDLLVGVEADGRSPHSAPAALYQDRFRQNRLAVLVPGLTLFRFTWADTYTPEIILTPLRQALRRT
ncbi:type IV toxin-antitoxin system AbiEi family antitoxin domain-containing protein [Streptomyces sp. XD-27]|uniref:type IV toxin-antitoxin system AbiEi family antitoxin domain-containing protein n=1 Tax=Streptomyces sp. XD-27 TaxID=3062779 RepID=UPI0026F430C7|nr:type IV toxin-antitoxin system AbiEi family antitoxin domain-containing protein [Streptomyces sp. XD-27]WKX68914.1 type IV toxin-antitoxin system AbiEi family antitoxin domain-containing protein [Streptomyces sp. XD-27]